MWRLSSAGSKNFVELMSRVRGCLVEQGVNSGVKSRSCSDNDKSFFLTFDAIFCRAPKSRNRMSNKYQGALILQADLRQFMGYSYHF